MEKYYHIVTYGCQMNVHESEKIAGILRAKGYVACDGAEEADIVVFNTCCIRENAENHAYGNIGALKKLKRSRPEMLIAVGGCMTQQEGAADRLRKKFPFVDIVFGTHNLTALGDLIDRKTAQKKAVVEIGREEPVSDEDEDISFRTSYPNAWVNIMYGCNNFCSYCIVPYVRGRERSRRPDNILSEVSALLDGGYKEITLLGQNVNSYGNDMGGAFSFPGLLDRICERKGKYRLRFMTSNPKDFGEPLDRKKRTDLPSCPSSRAGGVGQDPETDEPKVYGFGIPEESGTFKKNRARLPTDVGHHGRVPHGDGGRFPCDARPCQRGGFFYCVHVRIFASERHESGGHGGADPRRGKKRAHHAPGGSGQCADEGKIFGISRQNGGDSVRGFRREKEPVSGARRIRQDGLF